MTLYELGNEYLRSTETVQNRIKQLRPHLKGLTGDEEQVLRMRLRGLYTMAGDCKATGIRLQSYYGEGTQKWDM